MQSWFILSFFWLFSLFLFFNSVIFALCLNFVNYSYTYLNYCWFPLFFISLLSIHLSLLIVSVWIFFFFLLLQRYRFTVSFLFTPCQFTVYCWFIPFWSSRFIFSLLGVVLVLMVSFNQFCVSTTSTDPWSVSFFLVQSCSLVRPRPLTPGLI